MKLPVFVSICGILLDNSVSGLLENILSIHPATSHKIRPDLLVVTDQQEDKVLKIALHVGDPSTGQMSVSDLSVCIHHDRAEYDHVTLPGADGKAAKQFSCGHRALDVLSQGHYVDLSGTKYVEMEKGCWEICWREGKPAGTLVCGFELPEDYTRNAAHLPKGTIYVNFPVWTKAGLKVGQQEKLKLEEESLKYWNEHEQALYFAESTDNPFMQAIHNLSAEAAFEKYAALPHDMLEAIPEDNEVVHLQDDLLLTTKGSIMSNHKDGGHAFVGMATVSIPSSIKRLMP